ncbi:MAG: hypothetical protein ACYTEX_27390 [Planctomycetota bacterium]
MRQSFTALRKAVAICTGTQFVRRKEDRLERLIRGGLLKRANAKEVLTDMTTTIREGMRQAIQA